MAFIFFKNSSTMKTMDNHLESDIKAECDKYGYVNNSVVFVVLIISSFFYKIIPFLMYIVNFIFRKINQVPK
jgi:hypothetical protein